MLPDTNMVVDLSHWNGNISLAEARQSGIIGVIHKATQGTNYRDPKYVPNNQQAVDSNLLWGAYHFGTGGDGILQAEYFLATVNPQPETLLVLDLEADKTGPSMTLEEARAFVAHVNDITGRYPGLYSGHYLKELLGANQDPILAKCWLWLAQYGPTAVVPPNWPTWTMWQYTDGSAGPLPHDVPGIGSCDRDRFDGSEAELRQLWIGTSGNQSAVRKKKAVY